MRELDRGYATRLVRTRLFQAKFRERVLAAYKSQCAMCRLRHTRLLDAAHITPDRDPSGTPTISNGISLCRIHHGAFDAHMLAVHPTTMRIHVQPSLLAEDDGPMLQHGLKALEGRPLDLPRTTKNRPDPVHLATHWRLFQAAS